MSNKELNFLDLNNKSDVVIFDKIVSGEVDCQRCQFEGEETKCPMFELADEPVNPRECVTALWHGFKSFCELLPVTEDTDDKDN